MYVPPMPWSEPEKRRKRGRAQRKQIGRHDHAAVRAQDRPAPALVLLRHSMAGRVPALIRLKYTLMAESPFAFFRGAAPVMAADLAALPDTGILCRICGDAHVRNLGAYAAPDGRLIFDINDFDESVAGPFEWDLKRMAASLVLAGRAAGQKESAARGAVEACVSAYAGLMGRFAEMPHLEVARYQVHRLDMARPVHEALLKAERATPRHTLEQLTKATGKGSGQARRFDEHPPLLTRVLGAQKKAVLRSLTPYAAMLQSERQHLLSLYRVVDVAFKVVGTGSVGLRDYCVYLEGNGAADPLFLQIKEETESAYAPYLQGRHGGGRLSARRMGRHDAAANHQGRRVAEGQRAMQMQSDPFLGWTQMGQRQFLVRQLNDHKGLIDIEALAGENLGAYAEVCGELLARGHARSGDPLAIAGYAGSGAALAEALGRFGAAYADQTEKDWEELKRWRRARMK
jgi:uncharacterized protein (DUF2252 family)